MDVFHNPVTFGAYTIQQLAGYPRYYVHPWTPPFGPSFGCSNRSRRFSRGYDIFFILDFHVHLQITII